MENVFFNIDQLGLDAGLPTEEVESPFGKHSKVVWDGSSTVAVCKALREKAHGCGEVIGFCGGAPMWVMTAAVEAMFPETLHFHPGVPVPAGAKPAAPANAPAGGHGAPPPEITLVIEQLGFGEYVPEGDCEFDVKRDGNRVFVDFIADKPDKPQLYGGGHHSYNPDLLPLVKCPAVTADEDVFLSGAGSFNIIESIATAYFGKCRSLWVPAANPKNVGEFYCAVSYCDEVKVGDCFKL